MQDKDKLEIILHQLRIPHSFSDSDNVMYIYCTSGTIAVYFTDFGEYLDIIIIERRSK